MKGAKIRRLESCAIDYIHKAEFQKAIDYLKKLIEEEKATATASEAAPP